MDNVTVPNEWNRIYAVKDDKKSENCLLIDLLFDPFQKFQNPFHELKCTQKFFNLSNVKVLDSDLVSYDTKLYSNNLTLKKK